MGGCRRKGEERVQAEKDRRWGRCHQDKSQGVERGRRIQNDCWGCKTWRRGPREPVIAQKGYGIKPGPQAVETLLSCEEDRGRQNWHQRQESSPPETPKRIEDILGRTSPQWACGPALAPPTMGCGRKQVSGLELGA